jgi:type IV secretory pathway VirB10-like protein
VIEMSEDRAISVRAQLDLLIRTRQQRRRPETASAPAFYSPNPALEQPPDANETRPPAPIQATRRQPWTGPSIADELKSAAQIAEEAAGRDAAEIAARAAREAAKESQAKRRARELAKRGNALETAAGEGGEE